MYFGIYDTAHFVFHAAGDSRRHVIDLMRAAWVVHCGQTGADPGMFHPDDVNVIQLTSGKVCRDYDDDHPLLEGAESATWTGRGV